MISKYIVLIVLFFISVLNSDDRTMLYLEQEAQFRLHLLQKSVTASRTEERIIDAPASISIVSAEDIKNSGVTSIGALLSREVGVHLGYVNYSYTIAGGIRGFHKIPTNKIILLIDGIRHSMPIYGIINTTSLTISLTDIERIEILRGPGSAIYGPNAMFGVINIITKRPDEDPETTISICAGNFDHLISSITIRDYNDYFSYRLTAGYDRRNSHDYSIHKSKYDNEEVFMGADILYMHDNKNEFRFVLGLNRLLNRDYIAETTGPIDWSNSIIYKASIQYRNYNNNIRFQAYLNDWTENEGWVQGEKYLNFKMGERGVLFSHDFELFRNNNLGWGIDFINAFNHGTGVQGKQKHNIFGAYINNNLEIGDAAIFNFALRFDENTQTKNNTLSNRVSFIYNHFDKNIFRLTYGTSFRDPDFVEKYFNRISFLRNHESGLPMYIHVFGQEDVSVEKASTLEFAYITNPIDNLIFTTNIFYSQIKDFVFFVPDSQNPVIDLSPPARITILAPFDNIGDANQRGIELEIKYNWTENIFSRVNWSYTKQWGKNDIVSRELLSMTPENMGNAELNIRFDNGINTNFALRYKDGTVWRENSWGDIPVGGQTDKYLASDFSLSYNYLWNEKETFFSLTVLNLTNKKYSDFPVLTNKVHRKIFGKFEIKF